MWDPVKTRSIHLCLLIHQLWDKEELASKKTNTPSMCCLLNDVIKHIHTPLDFCLFFFSILKHYHFAACEFSLVLVKMPLASKIISLQRKNLDLFLGTHTPHSTHGHAPKLKPPTEPNCGKYRLNCDPKTLF